MQITTSNTNYSGFPFGMIMSERSFSSEKYRYGFNGKEKTDEINGEGNNLDFGGRIYDSRLGRWLSLDPLQKKYPSLTPYNFCANNPILFVDMDGKENIIYIVNVPDKNGKLTVSNADLTAQIIELNQYAEVNNMGVKYVLFNDYKENTPVPLLVNESIKMENLDKSDFVILIGEVDDVKKYDRDNNMTRESKLNSPGDAGWTGCQPTPYGSTPEECAQQAPVAYIDGACLNKSSEAKSYRKFLLLHVVGHSASPIKGRDDHLNMQDGVFPSANIMNDGDGTRLIVSDIYFKNRKANFMAEYFKIALDPKNNKHFFERVRKHYNPNGNIKPKDNYQSNKKARTYKESPFKKP